MKVFSGGKLVPETYYLATEQPISELSAPNQR
jgi:hypothetical protein